MIRTLFVYGTLRPGSGHPNARRLAREAVWLGRAEAAGALHLVAHYPGFVAAGRGTMRGVVRGDLVRLHDRASLAWLDAYEMCGTDDPLPHPYRRARILVRWRGRRVPALTYLWVAATARCPRVPGGDWLRRRR